MTWLEPSEVSNISEALSLPFPAYRIHVLSKSNREDNLQSSFLVSQTLDRNLQCVRSQELSIDLVCDPFGNLCFSISVRIMLNKTASDAQACSLRRSIENRAAFQQYAFLDAVCLYKANHCEQTLDIRRKQLINIGMF